MIDLQRNCIIRVNALLSQRFNLTPSSTSVVYHHRYDLTTGQRTDGTGNTKTCPGTGFFGDNTVSVAETNFIPLIRQQLANLPAVAPPPQLVALLKLSPICSMCAASQIPLAPYWPLWRAGQRCKSLKSAPVGTGLISGQW